MTVSIIIATYNWPKALSLVLDSIKNQTILPNEIIIADDGSTAETKQLIDDFKQQNNIILNHIWHKDDGFRLAEIRNKAIAATSSDYIIQIDGDVILHPKFIANHIKFAKKNTFISGSRVLLSDDTSQLAIENNKIFFSAFSKKIKNRFNALYIPFLNLFTNSKISPIEKLIFTVRGCNMSFWRKDLLDINGYDEQFKSWGREDSELALRLLNKGISLKKIKFAAIQFHLYHKEQDRSAIESNNLILKNNGRTADFYCVNGIIKK